MVHVLSNIVVLFSDNTFYMKRGINMWAQLCDIHKPCTPKDILANLHLIFILSHGLTQYTISYLRTIRNIIYPCKYGGGVFIHVPCEPHCLTSLGPTPLSKGAVRP